MKLVERQYFYPDLTVACGEGAGTMITNPVVVIEVLSPASEKRDRGAKFKAYKALPTIQDTCSLAANTRPLRFTGARGTSGDSTTIDRATWSNSKVSAPVFPLM